MPDTNALKAQTETINALLKRHEQGDAEATKQLKKRVDELDWNGCYGNLAAVAQHALLDGFLCVNVHTPPDEARRAAIEHQLRRWKEELAGPNPSPLEVRIIEQIGLDWLQANLAAGYVAVTQHLSTRDHAHHYDRIQTRAHARMVKGLKALAQVRRLQLPCIQVNIGQKQLNVANLGTIPVEPEVLSFAPDQIESGGPFASAAG